MQIKISVRNLVEFLLRSGNIDNRYAAFSDAAMAEGSRIHRMLQKRMGSAYQAEVPLRYVYATDSYDIVIEGRADGVIVDENGITIDEIKGTYRDIMKMEEPVGVHLAQAKCYAYLYVQQSREQPPELRVRMTYCNLDTEELRYFHKTYPYKELENWFLELVCQYQKWADMHGKIKDRLPSMNCSFPLLTGKDRRSLQQMYTAPSAIKESFF